MYLPEHFAETRVDVLHQLMRDHPLGSLVANGPSGLDANHLPFEWTANGTGHGSLLAHVARNNPLWQQVSDGADVLVIFHGPDAYVSPNWCPSKQETHRVVPTWNYMVVHAHGKITIRDDARFVRGAVARLTRTHEATTGASAPWKITDAPANHIEQLIASIVGIEIHISRLIGKWKLSQNREPRDRLNAAQELAQRGEDKLATAMQIDQAAMPHH